VGESETSGGRGVAISVRFEESAEGVGERVG
jgi:hypothetical protein